MNTKAALKAPGTELVSIPRFVANRKACRRWRIRQVNAFGDHVHQMSRRLGVPFVLGEDPGIGKAKLYRRVLMEMAFSEVNGRRG